jgi:hypothetical protein
MLRASSSRRSRSIICLTSWLVSSRRCLRGGWTRERAAR